MNSIRSAVALRTQMVDSQTEMQALNSAKIPNGATVFDNGTDTLWRLDKFAGDFFDAALTGSGVFLKPNDDTEARWFADSISNGSPYYSTSYQSGSVAVVMSAGQWEYLGSTPGTYALGAGNALLFTVNETTGEVTYNGPPIVALVSANASLLNGVAANSISVHACISRSGDVVVGSTTAHPSLGEAVMVTANVTAQISTERVVLLNPGTTIRLAFRNATNSDDLSVSFYNLSITPL